MAKKFQSPRSGKFVSDLIISAWFLSMKNTGFQSPRSGKFVSDKLRLSR